MLIFDVADVDFKCCEAQIHVVCNIMVWCFGGIFDTVFFASATVLRSEATMLRSDDYNASDFFLRPDVRMVVLPI
jgi:hypothetical protein